MIANLCMYSSSSNELLNAISGKLEYGPPEARPLPSCNVKYNTEIKSELYKWHQ